MKRNRYKICKEDRKKVCSLKYDVEHSILPGLALAHHTFDGFGKELFVPVDDELGDDFKKEFGIEDPEDDSDDGSDYK